MQRELLASHTQTPRQASAILIANPTSGSYINNRQQIETTVRFLQEHGWKARLELTQQQGDARRIAREAVEQKQDVVVAIGGDGTINEVIQELANSETALATVPSGTVNVWAREVGIPLDNTKARDVLLHGVTRRIDLGQVNDNYFLLMAGVGLDGEVTHAVEKKSAKRLGILGYLLVGLWKTLTYKGFRVHLILDGEQEIKTHAMQIVVGNTQLYGGAVKYTWKAKCDDGLLDVCIVRSQGFLSTVLVTLDLLLHRHRRRQWVRYEKCRELQVQTRHAIAIQIDGDPLSFTKKHGENATVFKIIPQALKVIVPKQGPIDIFAHDPME
ncbi:diacylglycerol/lipid kinase family protein [Ktedonospora formicarum]|uniref:diacylglycerol kinase (ATP) n=1 Tax=Ktedonospora formicarum TaxID=2778364 RepID=A0A8J3HWY3_9CHLR|nr:diacylglycerol kinase family protein [Ktedonospora formicarum]GHO43531.1 diacylglycerol kinase [Ktedonospora formicarum]